jgi:hypothetical protein
VVDVEVSRTPRVHHRPKVRKGWLGAIWWSECVCGHAVHYLTWRRAYVDALIHSEELK